MSDEDTHSQSKRRRLHNACDECRKKKIKCDSAIRSGNICSNCITSKNECTHVMASARKKSGPRIGLPRGKRPIQATVEAILSTRRVFEVPNDQTKVKQIFVDLANHIKELEEVIVKLRIEVASATAGSTVINPLTGAEDVLSGDTIPQTEACSDDSDSFQNPHSLEHLMTDLKRLEFDDQPVRHFGGSSSAALLKATMDIKQEYSVTGQNTILGSNRRTEFWLIHPWQIASFKEPPPFEFPPEDLMKELIDLYFTNHNQVFPVVHRPSFIKSFAEGLHHQDRYFGGLVLAMCAMGARFTDDPRVFENNSEQSAGWKYARQIRPLDRSFSEPPSIYDIQMYAVYISFVGPTTTPEISWPLIAVGIRLIQDVGAHRKQQSNAKPSPVTESWKRAFWVLYSMDIIASTFLGRPRAILQDDFDVDFPLEVDDEYWEHSDPNLTFQQPPGKPSTMAYWICFIKLMTILGSVLRNIYAVRQPDTSTTGLSNAEWKQKVVTELDSSLNKWTGEIPEHLKWDPNRENAEHFRQSAMLHTTYYWVQILVHRPFIPKPGEAALLNFPSLAISSNAARSCIRVLDVVVRRKETSIIVIPSSAVAWLNSALVLLINLWRGKKLYSRSINLEKELGEVQKVLDAFHLLENRWGVPGRFADVLMEVISVSHFPPDSNYTRSTLKRPRDPDNSDIEPVIYSGFNDGGIVEQRSIAGSNRVSAALELGSRVGSPSASDIFGGFNLPLQSGQLGSLPVYESFDWSTPQTQWISPTSLSAPVPNIPDCYPSEYIDFSLIRNPPPLEYPSGVELSDNIQDTHNTADDSPSDVDWTAYMTSIDEVLQTLNPRLSF